MSALTLIAILIALAIFGWAIWFVIELIRYVSATSSRNPHAALTTVMAHNKASPLSLPLYCLAAFQVRAAAEIL